MASNQKNGLSEESRDEIFVRLRDEFLAEARSCLDDIAEELTNSEKPDADAEQTLLAIRRQCHSLKGMGSSFGFPAVTLI